MKASPDGLAQAFLIGDEGRVPTTAGKGRAEFHAKDQIRLAAGCNLVSQAGGITAKGYRALKAAVDRRQAGAQLPYGFSEQETGIALLPAGGAREALAQ